MRRRRRGNNSIAHSQSKNFFDARNVELPRCRAKTFCATGNFGQPKIAIARFDLADRSEFSSRPVAFDPANNARFALNSFWLLMLNGFQVSVAQLCQGQLSLGPVNLPLLVFEARQLAARNRTIGRFQGAFDLLAVNPDAAIIDAVG